jgi:UDP-glucose 4-epimerase
MSTTHVYGPQVGRLEETTLPAPRHPYATSHRAAEDAVLAASGNFTAMVLRLSNGFGAPTHAQANCWTLLVNDLCRQAVTDCTLRLRSAGLQHRDFIPLADVTRIVDHMLHLDARY